MSQWNVTDIPDQTGRTIVVTGANTGLGYQTALALARKGAKVIIAARDPAKADAAVRAIRAQSPESHVTFIPLDLADLGSVSAFCQSVADRFDRVDTLINNAGVMTPKKRQVTRDGFELQLGVNFLGHFALTMRLLPLLRHSDSPRVVNLSSIMHKWGRIDFSDLMSERSYSPVKAYGQSKLATLLFSHELQRRSNRHGWGLRSVAAHPGIARTELTKSRPGQEAMSFNRISDVFAPLFTGTAASGALPSLYAATSAEATPGGYYGPQDLFEIRGPVGRAKTIRRAVDAGLAAKLWDTAEVLLKKRFDS